MHQLHGVIGELVAEEFLVAAVEALTRRGQPVREPVLHVLLVVLLRVAHAQAEPLARCAAQPLRFDLAPPGLQHGVEARGQLRFVHLRVTQPQGLHPLHPQPRQGGPEGRAQTGMRWHHHPAYAQLGGDGGGVQGPGAAEGDQHEVARIDPALDGQQADGVGHVLVGEVDDGPRGRFPPQSQRSRQRVDHRRRALRVELQFPAQKEVGVEPAQHQVGVGHGGGFAAGAVAAGAGPGARALGSHREHAALVDTGDGTAAGAQRAHLDHRNRHRQPPLDLIVGGELRLAIQQ